MLVNYILFLPINQPKIRKVEFSPARDTAGLPDIDSNATIPSRASFEHILDEENRKYFDVADFIPRKINTDKPNAIVSLFTGAEPGFVRGAAVLAYSLRKTLKTPTTGKVALILVHLPGVVTEETKEDFRAAGWDDFLEVPKIKTKYSDITHIVKFRDMLAKLWSWRLTQFKHVISIDSDMIAVDDISPLFEISGTFTVGAVMDNFLGTWVNGFNAGLLLVHPNHELFLDLLAHAIQDGSKFDGNAAEQAFLNFYTKHIRPESWRRLDLEYNGNLIYYEKFPEIFRNLPFRIIHYTMSKPWLDNSENAKTGHPTHIWRSLENELQRKVKQDV